MDKQQISTHHAPKVVVVMGRPGAGKSTITARVIELIDDTIWSTPTTTTTAAASRGMAHTKVVPLDLDVCVPDWMRANFAMGIYPTLSQRQDFANVCCDYVGSHTNSHHHDDVAATSVVLLVSFSFVNVDLRDSFRDRFPGTRWILIDTSESEAQRRIEQRQGHFYKGIQQADRGDADWKFAPVTFPHTILDGLVSVDENATRILSLIREIL